MELLLGFGWQHLHSGVHCEKGGLACGGRGRRGLIGWVWGSVLELMN